MPDRALLPAYAHEFPFCRCLPRCLSYSWRVTRTECGQLPGRNGNQCDRVLRPNDDLVISGTRSLRYDVRAVRCRGTHRLAVAAFPCFSRGKEGLMLVGLAPTR